MAIDGGNLPPGLCTQDVYKSGKEVTDMNPADSIFGAGSVLQINEGWISGSGRTVLRLQQDRNLVLYLDGNPA